MLRVVQGLERNLGMKIMQRLVQNLSMHKKHLDQVHFLFSYFFILKVNLRGIINDGIYLPFGWYVTLNKWALMVIDGGHQRTKHGSFSFTFFK